MRLREMTEKPKSAGLAILDFSEEDEHLQLPIRKGKKIFLPDEPNDEFLPLQQGKQFLFVRHGLSATIWFGGTDEYPFLVELEWEVLHIFKEKGEAGFYSALKPDIFDEFGQAFGIDPNSALRQGDIWAFPFPEFLSWEQIEIMAYVFCPGWNSAFCSGCSGCSGCSDVEKAVKDPDSAPDTRLDVFGTRHTLIGTYMHVGNPDLIIAEGVITAPDHKTLQIPGPHILAQTQYLNNPEDAD